MLKYQNRSALLTSFIILLIAANLFIIRLALTHDPEYLWLMMGTLPILLLMIHIKISEPLAHPELREKKRARQMAEQTNTMYSPYSIKPKLKEKEVALLQ
ncbi:MAG: hypothetical protein IPL97_01160 [Niastella sp.]|nr:hypothetical protein [Niastella sp.]